MINQMIIGTSFYQGPPPPPPWPTGTDPGSGTAEIFGVAQLGLWLRRYNNYYFADDIDGVLAATPSVTGADTGFFIYDNANDFFTCMWTGYLSVPNTGAGVSTYKFKTMSDDASYFWIGTDAFNPSVGNADVNNGGLHGSQEAESDFIALTEGLYYPVRMIFGEQAGGEVFQLSWNRNNEGWVQVNSDYARYNANDTVNGFSDPPQ